MKRIKRAEENLRRFIERIPELSFCQDSIWQVFLAMVKTYEKNGKILLAGNGGSAADADHIVGELMKGFMIKRELKEENNMVLPWVSKEESEKILSQLQYGLKAINLTAHTALNTAFANDVNPDLIFAQQVFTLGEPGDIYMGISTSGNSKNVFYGGAVAKAKGLICIGLTGEDGGLLKEHFDVVINVPSNSTPIIQEYHLPIYHELCKWVEEYFFKEVE